MGTVAAGKLFLEGVTSMGDSFDSTALSRIKDIHAFPGRLICSMPVDSTTQNRYGTLHGGCAATLVDSVSSAALVTVSQKSGVSVAINLNYLSPMPAGEDVEVDARVVKVGRTLATMSVELRQKSTGRLCVSATHTKFLNGDEKDISGKACPAPPSKL